MMQGQMYFKEVAGIVSMQEMMQAFNAISKNLSRLVGCQGENICRVMSREGMQKRWQEQEDRK